MDEKLAAPNFSGGSIPNPEFRKPESVLSKNSQSGERLANYQESQPEVQKPGPAEANAVAGGASNTPVLIAPVNTPAVSTVNDTIGDPEKADDKDVIERVWVDKAKQIIQNTRNSPYDQEIQMGKLQAVYIKKRYGKDIKVSDT